MALGYIQEGRRAGAAVQILVAAAHGQIDAGGAELQLDGPGAVAEVPQDHAALGLHGLGDRQHVELLAGLVVDVGQHHEGVGTGGRDDFVARQGADAD
jgi:hypothetical protein